MSNFTAIFKLRANAQGFNSVLNQAKAAIAGLGPKLGDGLKAQVGKIFSVNQGFQMLKGTMEEVLNRAKQYNNLGARMGVSAEEVQKLDKIAEQAGINVSSLQRGMMLVGKFGKEAMDGTNKKFESFARQLKASTADLQVMAAGGKDGLIKLAELMDTIQDKSDRDYIGLKIFGEKWPEIMQLMDNGGKKIKQGADGVTVWGASTQESLSRIQRAWANMWNDLSVFAAELLAFFEPVIGVLRIILNIIAIIYRVWSGWWRVMKNGVQGIIKGIIAGVATLFSFSNAKNLTKQFYKALKQNHEDFMNWLGNLGSDLGGVWKGVKQIFGYEMGDEMDGGVDAEGRPVRRSTDTRSAEERAAYEEALEAEHEKALAVALTNAKEEEKLDILKQQLDILKKQEDELKKKHPDKYKETKEYLELNAKMLEHERKIEEQRRKDEKSAYDKKIDLIDFANERRLKKMQDAGASEEDILKETVTQQKETAVRLADELDKLNNDKLASQDEKHKKALELAKAIAKTEDTIYEQRKADKDIANQGSKAVTSTLQKVGGGGAVAIVSTAAKQLMEAEETNRLLAELVALSQKVADGKANAGTYGRP